MPKSILIIEDNTDVRENTAELLSLAGYNVITTKDGKEGVESALANKPDLILCDIMMPELDGYGVLKAFEGRSEMARIPFIFMTAKAEKSDLRTGMDLGADDYLTKPFSEDELLKMVKARLKKLEILRNEIETSKEGLSDFIKTVKTYEGVNQLSDHRIVKKLRKKDMLFMEGDSPNFLYFVMSGKIKVFKSNDSGKEYIIDIHNEGDFLGYVALLEGTAHKEYAMAIEPSEVALIPTYDFLKLLYSNNEVAIKFVRMITHHFAEAEEKLVKLAYDSARKRVAEAILFVLKKYQVDGKEEMSFSVLRENISALSGISPESVSRNLTDFKNEGLIETLNGKIKILNFKKLEMLKN